MAVVRWKIKDIASGTEYTFPINPNAGGTPGIQRSVGSSHVLGPNSRALVWEGAAKPSELQFSGIILTQAHLEAMEAWAMKRALIQITDDLGRVFQGVFESWSPTRDRRGTNPWYHTFSASICLTAMKNASGTLVYGQIVTDLNA